MTATVPAGHAATTARDVSTLTWMLSLVHGDADAAARIRRLGDEIDDIHADMAMARQMRPETTAEWEAELVAEERRVRRELKDTAGLP